MKITFNHVAHKIILAHLSGMQNIAEKFKVSEDFVARVIFEYYK